MSEEENVEITAPVEDSAPIENIDPSPADTVVAEPVTSEPQTLREKMEARADEIRAKASTEKPAKPKEPEEKPEPKPDEKPDEKPDVLQEKETPAFTPKTKFNVQSKEFEIPKEFHSLMKDKASEKMVHDLFTKAEGIEPMRNALVKLDGERINAEKQVAEFKHTINDAGHIYRKAVETGDFLKLDAFWKRIGADPNVVMQYALAKAKYAQMQPQDQQIIDQRLQAETRAAELEQQNQGAVSRTQQLEIQMKTFMLDTRLASPDVSALTKAFDEQVSRPGAFRDEVIREGQLAFMASQKDLTPDEAIQAVIKRYNIKASAVPSTTENVQGEAAKPVVVPAKPAPGTKVVVERKTGTIPNLQGTSSSPLKAKPKNLEDLRALHKQKLSEAQGA